MSTSDERIKDLKRRQWELELDMLEREYLASKDPREMLAIEMKMEYVKKKISDLKAELKEGSQEKA